MVIQGNFLKNLTNPASWPSFNRSNGEQGQLSQDFVYVDPWLSAILNLFCYGSILVLLLSVLLVFLLWWEDPIHVEITHELIDSTFGVLIFWIKKVDHVLALMLGQFFCRWHLVDAPIVRKFLPIFNGKQFDLLHWFHFDNNMYCKFLLINIIFL